MNTSDQLTADFNEEVKKKNKDRYLRIIQYLTSEIDNYPDLREDIYELAHIALEECKNPHSDWIKKWDEVHEQIKIHL